LSQFGLLLSDIRTRVSSVVGLDNTASSAEQQLIDSWTNEACVDFLERTKAKVELATITLTPNQGDYEIPTGALIINDITVTNASDGQVLPLEPIPYEELIWRRRYPGAVPVRYYAFSGANLLSLYPTPQTPDTMDISYVPYPGLLVNATDPLTNTGIPPQFHYIIELYVKAKAGDYNDDASSQNGMLYDQQYQLEVKKARGRIRRLQGRRRPPALPGRRDRRKYYPAYPGQDTGGY
jgi:hypothetical protein